MSRLALPLFITGLPVILLLSSLRTLRVLEDQRMVYLRSRAAAVTGILEALPNGLRDSDFIELVAGEEPALVGLRILSPESPGAAAPSLEPLWEARELFRSEMVDLPEGRVFRTDVPFHSEDGLRIARIDLDPAAADFLVTHARHNVLISSLSGLALIALAIYAIWAARRTTRLEVRQLQMEHLARLGQMAAVLAHEIRNPLGTVKGFVQLAAEKQDDPGRELLEPAVEEIQRIENLVSDLLLYGRPPDPRLRRVQWSEILERLRQDTRFLAQAQHVQFAASDQDFEWETDPALLEHILLNLLRNAFEAVASREDAQVRLEARLGARGEVILTVLDNGPGIPPEARARLFEPFSTTKTTGTGLGLAIARSLARTLGGEVTLKDASPQGAAAEAIFPSARGRRSK